MNAQEAELLKLYNSLSDEEASQLTQDEINDYERLLSMSKNEPSPIWGGVAGYDKRTPMPTGEMQPEAKGQAQVKPTLFQDVPKNVDKYIKKPLRSAMATVEAVPALLDGADIGQRLGNYAERYQTLANRGNEDLNIAEQVATDPTTFVSAPAKVLATSAKLAPKFAQFLVKPAVETGTQAVASNVLNEDDVGAGGVAVGTGMGVALPKVGKYLSNRAKGQAYGSVVASGKYSQNKNPITPDKIETELLAKNAFPIFTTEAKSFGGALNFLKGEVAKEAKDRELLARGIDKRINLATRYTPMKSHFEAIPKPDAEPQIIPLLSKEELSNQGKEGAYKRAMNKFERDPNLLYADRPELPNLVENPKHYLQGSSVKEWDLMEMIDQQPQKIKGAVDKAIQAVRIRFKNDPTIGKKVIANIEEWAEDIGISSAKKRTVGAQRVSEMVSQLNESARNFGRINGAVTPFEVSRSEIASAINNEIERNIPELREATRKMGGKMALIKPIEDRILKPTVQQPRSGIPSLPIINEIINLETTLNRRPQGAQLKYNVGQSMNNGLLGQARRFAIPTSQAMNSKERK